MNQGLNNYASPGSKLPTEAYIKMKVLKMTVASQNEALFLAIGSGNKNGSAFVLFLQNRGYETNNIDTDDLTTGVCQLRPDENNKGDFG